MKRLLAAGLPLLLTLVAGCGGPRPTGGDLVRADLGDTLHAASSGPWVPPPESSDSPPERAPAGRRVPGFPVQIDRSLALVDAEKRRDEAERQLNRSVDVEFRAPYYRLLVGSSLTREEAELLRQELLRLGYEGATVVEGLVTAR